MDISC